MEQPRRSGREQACPKQFEDYEVYVTVEEEEFMLTTCADDDMVSTDNNDDRALEAVVHYIMMHFEKKETIKKGRNISSRMDNTVLMPGFVISVIGQRRQSQKSCISSTRIQSLSQSQRIA